MTLQKYNISRAYTTTIKQVLATPKVTATHLVRKLV